MLIYHYTLEPRQQLLVSLILLKHITYYTIIYAYIINDCKSYSFSSYREVMTVWFPVLYCAASTQHEWLLLCAA